MNRRHGSGGHRKRSRARASQPVNTRLPKYARDRIIALTRRLLMHATAPTVAGVTRGLCALSLEGALGTLGRQVADAFRIAAITPTRHGVRDALRCLGSLLDTELPELGAEQRTWADGPPELLVPCPLRVLAHQREPLDALVVELRATGSKITLRSVLRGLCLLAQELADGAAGAEVERAFCRAANDPTPEGMRQALEALRTVFDGPSTIPGRAA